MQEQILEEQSVPAACRARVGAGLAQIGAGSWPLRLCGSRFGRVLWPGSQRVALRGGWLAFDRGSGPRLGVACAKGGPMVVRDVWLGQLEPDLWRSTRAMPEPAAVASGRVLDSAIALHEGGVWPQ